MFDEDDTWLAKCTDLVAGEIASEDPITGADEQARLLNVHDRLQKALTTIAFLGVQAREGWSLWEDLLIYQIQIFADKMYIARAYLELKNIKKKELKRAIDDMKFTEDEYKTSLLQTLRDMKRDKTRKRFLQFLTHKHTNKWRDTIDKWLGNYRISPQAQENENAVNFFENVRNIFRKLSPRIEQLRERKHIAKAEGNLKAILRSLQPRELPVDQNGDFDERTWVAQQQIDVTKYFEHHEELEKRIAEQYQSTLIIASAAESWLARTQPTQYTAEGTAMVSMPDTNIGFALLMTASSCAAQLDVSVDAVIELRHSVKSYNIIGDEKLSEDADTLALQAKRLHSHARYTLASVLLKFLKMVWTWHNPDRIQDKLERIDERLQSMTEILDLENKSAKLLLRDGNRQNQQFLRNKFENYYDSLLTKCREIIPDVLEQASATIKNPTRFLKNRMY